jgi:hypothetical protein
MRVAHGIFGALFNKAHKRTGKVANERPKTPLIGDLKSEIRTHFYIEANPVRARKTQLEKLRNDKYNSYRYFAYGEVDPITENITPPEWYLGLAKTPEKRQKLYRELFMQYLCTGKEFAARFFKPFIGSIEWIQERKKALSDLLAENRVTSQSAQAPPGS